MNLANGKRILRVVLWPLQMVLILLIKFYQLVISPWLPNACRFHPTCSQYGIEAITKYGIFKGSYLLTKRILNCRPWGGHGHDPVP